MISTKVLYLPQFINSKTTWSLINVPCVVVGSLILTQYLINQKQMNGFYNLFNVSPQSTHRQPVVHIEFMSLRLNKRLSNKKYYGN